MTSRSRAFSSEVGTCSRDASAVKNSEDITTHCSVYAVLSTHRCCCRCVLDPIGYVHGDLDKVQVVEGKLHLFVAIDRRSRFAFAQLVEESQSRHRVGFPQGPDRGRAREDPHRATDNGIQFRYPPRYANGPTHST